MNYKIGQSVIITVNSHPAYRLYPDNQPTTCYTKYFEIATIDSVGFDLLFNANYYVLKIDEIVIAIRFEHELAPNNKFFRKLYGVSK